MEGDFKTKISFKLQDQNYAFNSLKVRNILPFEDNITPVPRTENYILGVINLHGNIIPIVDLRTIMGITEKELTRDTSIIIISPDDKNDTQFGVVVDMVSEVFEVKNEDIMPASFEKGMGMIEQFEGTIQIKDEFIHLIDIMHLSNQLDRKSK